MVHTSSHFYLRRRIFIQSLLVALLCTSAGGTEQGKAAIPLLDSSRLLEPDQECIAVEKCEMCTFSDQKGIPACKATGRRQKFECRTVTSDGDEVNKKSEIRSCLHTEADNEFAMVRLQMICLVMGSMAFLSTRKQKRISASLFDQRKQGAKEQQKHGRRNSDAMAEQQTIEFSGVEQEMVPLVDTSSNPLEVI